MELLAPIADYIVNLEFAFTETHFVFYLEMHMSIASILRALFKARGRVESIN